ncbi:MAG TPA: hypothetical protein VIK39_02775 [Candidatus Angelobacter sp.]
MKFYQITSILLFLATCASAQSPPTSRISPANPTHTLAVVVQINNELNTKKLKIGDKVNATVIQDMVAAGKIVIPRGARLIGHVSGVTRLSKADPRSRLALVFDRGERKGGGTLPLHGFVQAMAPPLPDPKLEAIMASSSYGGAENGHPVNGGMMSTGQNNASTPITGSRRPSAAEELQQREKALEDAEQPKSSVGGPHGALSASSRGVFGLPGLALSSSGPVPVIVTVGQNIELKSGTQIVLRLDESVLQQ